MPAENESGGAATLADTDNRHPNTDHQESPIGHELADALENTLQTESERSEELPESARSGEDVRHRGWFWHWNTIVTQYAPLIGLKGIGLLNSYTTWTDRREYSPYRGFAFPSQKSEAAFYGEDRAELITINKILVALDLIEIRKEMILRTDEQGRRWKVPHNFYRVKDRSDGADLTYEDVARVIELAAEDKPVFRYLRRLFSSKFKPIDSGNPWHDILDRLEGNPTWEKLRLQIASKEAKASARARRGHKARTTKTGGSKDRSASDADTPAPEMTNGHSDTDTLHDSEQKDTPGTQKSTSDDQFNTGSPPVVEPSNTALSPIDDLSNSAFEGNEATFAEKNNTGSNSVVEQSNTMYYQEDTTTTTTDPVRSETESAASTIDTQRSTAANRAAEDGTSPDRKISTNGVQHPQLVTPQSSIDKTQSGLSHTNDEQSLDDPSSLVISLFESANDRAATGLERILLSELAEDADPAARAAGSTGADWVAAALREAVASGSSFVAPKRLREIVTRWAVEGVSPSIPGRIEPAIDLKLTRGDADRRSREQISGDREFEYLDRLWQKVAANMRRSMERATYDRLFSGSKIDLLRGNQVHVIVASPEARDKLSMEYSSFVSRSFQQELQREIDVIFRVVPLPGEEMSAASEAQPAYTLSLEEERDGRRLWNAVMTLLRDSIPARDLDHLQGIVPLGQNKSGELVLGLPGKHAERLYATRYSRLVDKAVRDLLGSNVEIITAGSEKWTIEKD